MLILDALRAAPSAPSRENALALMARVFRLVELAARLGIQQAAVSKVERRQDLHLDTLSAIVTALGGTLEMKVKFPGGEVPLRMVR